VPGYFSRWAVLLPYYRNNVALDATEVCVAGMADVSGAAVREMAAGVVLARPGADGVRGDAGGLGALSVHGSAIRERETPTAVTR
jgi:hypothetical protein